jgi:hypothetical protein
MRPTAGRIAGRTLWVASLVLLVCGGAAAQSGGPPGPPRQTQADDYTSQFKIVYEVTATTPGTRFFFNVIRAGSEASDEAAYDASSGQPLRFEVVTGAQARADGLVNADMTTGYIKIWLLRAVPEKGEIRLRIEKTYKDTKSYYREGESVVFDRSLGIKRNAVVLPGGYELVFCNVPSQVATEADGRIRVSFMNQTPAAMPLVVKGRPLTRAGK